MNKTLILFLYKEDETTKDNLEFFVKHGVSFSNEADFIFLVNDFICTVEIPSFENVKIIMKQNGFDLPSYKTGLDSVDLNVYSSFIFLNSSCIGPFLPAFITTPWYQLISNYFSPTIKLVGPVVEVPPDKWGGKAITNYKFISPYDSCIPFIHTYMFGTDSEGLSILLQYKVFDETSDREKLIHVNERLISSSILNEGYDIKSFLLKFLHVNLSEKSNWRSDKWSNGKKTCPEIPLNYGGIDIDPFEVMFFKNIRTSHQFRSFWNSGISKSIKLVLERYSKWMKE